MEFTWRAIFILISICQLAGGAKILMIPMYHYSHINLFAVAGKALAANNHDVTMLANKTFEKIPTKMGIKSVSYIIPNGMAFSDKLNTVAKSESMSIGLMFQTTRDVLPSFGQVCELILGDEMLMSHIMEQAFDLVILDGVPIMNCLYVIPYKYNIPYITLSAVLDPWSAGVTGLPSVEPIQFFKAHNQMTFFQRLQTLVAYTAIYLLPQVTLGGNYYVEKYAREKPSVSGHEIYRKSGIFLVNHDITCLDFPRVSAPNYVFIGGSSAKEPQPLSEDVKSFIEGAEHGIIVMSFGSVKAWQNLWTKMKPKMIHAFGLVKQRALILYSSDDTNDFPPNVKAMKWLPQNDLLGNSKTKLFITHGGNNGQLEAAYHGVPMLVIPIGGDQIYNGVRTQHRGYGKVLLQGIETSQEEIYDAMHEILSNKTYAENIKKCSDIIKSEPSSQEKIVHWVNHILRFGGDHLKPPGVELSLFQLLMIDLFLFLLVIMILKLVFCIFCCRCMYRRCCQAKPKAKTE